MSSVCDTVTMPTFVQVQAGFGLVVAEALAASVASSTN